MNFKIKIGKENMLEYAIAANISYAAYATWLYSIIGNSSILRNIIISFVMGINLYTVYKNRSRIKNFIYLIVMIGALFAVTYIIYSSNQWFISSIIVDTIKYIMLAYFLSIAKFETLSKGLKASAYIILFCSLFEPITKYVTSGNDGYMVYGMRLLISAVLLEYFYFRENNSTHLISCIIAILMILFYGNRSALLISCICLLVQFLFYRKKKPRIVRYLEFIGIAFLAVILLSGDILTFLSGGLEKMGVSSRTLTLLLTGIESATDNNGRSIIWENSRNAIVQNPWLGYGIGGDRNLYLLGTKYISRLGGVYAHNFIYEILLDFGVIGGSVFLLFILEICVKILRSKTQIELKRLFFILIISTSLKLFFSSSIWNDLDAFICLGLAMNYFRNAKAIKYSQRVFNSGEVIK